MAGNGIKPPTDNSIESEASKKSVSETQINIIMKELNDMKVYMKSIEYKNSCLQKEIKRLTERQYDVESRFNSLSQYSRRENIELHNVPESILPKKLENHVLKVLNSIGVMVESYDLVAVHRIGKKRDAAPRKVLIRFINRKDAYETLYKNKALKSTKESSFKKYFFTENLCPENQKIFNKLFKLKKDGIIHNVWTYKSEVYFNFRKDGEYMLAQHYDDIEYYINEDSNNDDININASLGNHNSELGEW